MEEEIDGILPFLDVSEERVDDKLDFKIYYQILSNKKWLPSTVWHID
jgi:hypothetical protein